jgi:hypothetical protein
MEENMAANAEKTVEYAFVTNSGSLLTNTALNTSTRYNFPLIGVTLPETTSRSFKSVMLECNWRDAYATVYNVTGWRLGITCGSNAAGDLDFLPTAIGNTGDHESGIVIRDVTDYFNTNFGTSASNSCQASIAIATATTSFVQNLTAKLYITYEYDATSGSRSIKTVRIPIQSASALLGVTAVEIGTGGTNAAPANQIPALDSFLPESNKTYQSTWFEMFANDGGAATTLFSASYVINTGTSASRCRLQQALNTGTYFYDIWTTKYNNGSAVIVNDYVISASAASAFKVSVNLANRFDAFGGLYCVTYEYDRTSASVMNSIILPVDTNPGYVGSTATADGNYFQRDFWVEETGITLAQSGVLFYAQSAAGATLNILAGEQSARPYTLTALVNSGGHAVVHRIDHNSGFTLGRGKNTLNLKTFTTAAAAVNSLVGLAYLNYTSASASQGESAHNHTTIWCLTPYRVSGAATVMEEVSASTTRAPSIANSEYFLNGAGYELGSRFGVATNGISLHSEKLAGEYNGDGWRNIDAWIHTNDGELATYNQIGAGLDEFNPDSNHANAGLLDIETARKYRVHYSTAGFFWLRLFLTYHSNIFVVSGSFSNPTGSGSNVIVDVIRTTDDYWSGSTLSTASGSYSLNIFDNVYPVYASASQDGTHVGRSASALATVPGTPLVG